MYRWIWDRLPFGWHGKLAGSAVLLVGVAALLWYVVFPAVDPLLPVNDVQVVAPTGSPTDYSTVVPSPDTHRSITPVPTASIRPRPAPSPGTSSLPK